MSLSLPAIQAASRVLREHQRILVCPHSNVDPDGLSAALACAHMFRALGKEVTVLCPDTPPQALTFLPGYERLERDVHEDGNVILTINLDAGVEVDKLRYAVEDNHVNIIIVPKHGKIHQQQVHFSEGEPSYDLIVVVDSAELSLLGSVYREHIDLFSRVPILNIDHHISNAGFGQVQLLDSTASSATEVLYQWFTQASEFAGHLTPDVATLLLTGLITDTRSFQNPNTTPRALEVASDLLERGARQQEIIQHVYKTKPLSTLKVWGRALNRIQVDPQSRIVWSTVSKEDLLEMEAKSSETHGILDELISTIPESDLYVLFTEVEEGGLKASGRSSTAVDLSALFGKLFNGGGHARAAGFKIKSYDNFQLAVLDCIRQMREEIARQKTQSLPPHQLGQQSALPPAQGSGPASSSPMQAAFVAPPVPVRPETDVLQAVTQLTSPTAPRSHSA